MYHTRTHIHSNECNRCTDLNETCMYTPTHTQATHVHTHHTPTLHNPVDHEDWYSPGKFYRENKSETWMLSFVFHFRIFLCLVTYSHTSMRWLHRLGREAHTHTPTPHTHTEKTNHGQYRSGIAAPTEANVFVINHAVAIVELLVGRNAEHCGLLFPRQNCVNSPTSAQTFGCPSIGARHIGHSAFLSNHSSMHEVW